MSQQRLGGERKGRENMHSATQKRGDMQSKKQSCCAPKPIAPRPLLPASPPSAAECGRFYPAPPPSPAPCRAAAPPPARTIISKSSTTMKGGEWQWIASKGSVATALRRLSCCTRHPCSSGPIRILRRPYTATEEEAEAGLQQRSCCKHRLTRESYCKERPWPVVKRPKLPHVPRDLKSTRQPGCFA